jgi:hypothetical protein
VCVCVRACVCVEVLGMREVAEQTGQTPVRGYCGLVCSAQENRHACAYVRP